MRTDRVVLRAVLTTLLSIVVLFGVMLLFLCLLFPGTMTQLTYELGMNESSVKYASRAYKRTDDVYYAAFAFETSIVIEDVENIEKYGELLIKDDEFQEYCQFRNGEIAAGNEKEEEKITLTYQQYVYGQVAVAQYTLGNKTEAIETAFTDLEGFPPNNAAAVLYLTALQAKDGDTVQTLRPKLEEIIGNLETSSVDYTYAYNLLAIPTP